MKQKPAFLDDEGMISSPNGYKSLSNLASLGNMSKYDLRNYSEPDALALRIAYLTDKTWLRNHEPNCEWSSLHGAAKRTGEHKAWGIGKPKLIVLMEKMVSLLKRRYSQAPEKLKELISPNNLSEEEMDKLIQDSKVKTLYFNTTSDEEVNECKSLEGWRKQYYLAQTVNREIDSPRRALVLGRLYLSDVARRAYSELTGNPILEEDSFIERVANSIDAHQARKFVEGESLLRSAVNSMEIYQGIFRGGR